MLRLSSELELIRPRSQQLAITRPAENWTGKLANSGGLALVAAPRSSEAFHEFWGFAHTCPASRLQVPDSAPTRFHFLLLNPILEGSWPAITILLDSGRLAGL